MDSEPRKWMIRQMVDQLNRLLATDADWCNRMIMAQSPTNQAVADSDCWMAGVGPEEPDGGNLHMRVLGMLNGLLGPGDERIAAETEREGPDKGKLHRFWVAIYDGERFVALLHPDGTKDETARAYYHPTGDI